MNDRGRDTSNPSLPRWRQSSSPNQDMVLMWTMVICIHLMRCSNAWKELVGQWALYMTMECNLQDRTIPPCGLTQSVDLSQWIDSVSTESSRGAVAIAISRHSHIAISLPQLIDGVGIKGSIMMYDHIMI